MAVNWRRQTKATFMGINFFKITFRNITQHKGFSFINIAGLTLGLTACILIGLFVWDENQYDKFLSMQIRFIVCMMNTPIMMARKPWLCPHPMFATTLQQDFPEVEKTARVMMLPPTKTLFETVAIKNCMKKAVIMLTQLSFDVFPLAFKYGSYASALNDISSIVLSQGNG